jgi:asparagine synthase (glutamine-hydrolysing)
MNTSQAHRGPDGEGVHVEPGVGLGHRRLSIIDVATGQQPLYNEDGSVVVVFNGEIYNYQSLIPELVALGHVFHTRSDTEVIVHAWEAWGERCVERFRGMFAFALWDRHRETLFLARDRLGVKPLYYAVLPDGTLLFGSELKSLLAHGGLARTIDPCAIEEYFALGYVAEPRTVFAGARKLPPAHTLSIRRGEPVREPACFWDPRFTLDRVLTPDEAFAELAARLDESVKLRLISEVPLGAFLSGGVDSSAVVASMARVSDGPVNTCSIGFDDPAFNEIGFAQQVADRYHTQHHVETVASNDFSLVDKLAQVYDEPYADSSALPTYRVCELARKHVKVALSGDGGDEHFAGYRRYRMAMGEQRVRSLLPLGLRKPTFGFLGAVYPKADWAPRVLRAKTTFEALARDLVEGYFHGVSILPDRVRDQLFTDKFRRELQGYRAIEVFRAHERNAPTDDPLSVIQYIDMKTYLPGDILTKVDRASMAHALEVRVPLLDHKFVEWVSGLPSTVKLKAGEGKDIFKKSLKPYLSDDILYRKKMGFSIPLGAWLRGPLRDKVRAAVLNPALLDTGIFNEQYLRQMVDQHNSGAKDHTVSLWSVLMFDAFLRTNGASATARN